MMLSRALSAMPLKGEFAPGAPEGCGILAAFGEVAEWLKAAPC